MLFLGSTIILLTTMITQDVFAEEENNSTKNPSITEHCNELPRPGVNWQGCDLSGRNLESVNFSGADLHEMNFSGANLRNANFSDAYLYKANLQFADLQGAYFTHPPCSALQNYCGANLQGANLTGANLEYANLKGINLYETDLSHANLYHANLEIAGIMNSNLEYANLTSADFTGSFLDGSNLQGVDLHGMIIHARMSATYLQNANLSNADLQMVEGMKLNLAGSDLQGVELKSADLENAVFANASLQNAQLQGSILNSADFSHSNVNYANFSSAMLDAANFRYASMQNVDLTNTHLANADLTGAIIKNVKIRGTDIQEATQNGKKLSPIRQTEYGRTSDEVVCPHGLVLLKRPSSTFLACVRPTSAIKLMTYRWDLVDKATVTLSDGQNNGPFLVQEIYADHVVGLKSIYWMGGISKEQITLHLGESVDDRCLGTLFLITIHGKNATFAYVPGGLCPICLSGNTMIDTPNGSVNIKELHGGMLVWTEDNLDHKQSSVILKTSRVLVPSNHMMVHVTLDDSRELFGSLGHPTADGRFLRDLKVGDILDGAQIKNIERVSYDESYTYDILPSGQTGFYWANGILVGSTLK